MINTRLFTVSLIFSVKSENIQQKVPISGCLYLDSSPPDSLDRAEQSGTPSGTETPSNANAPNDCSFCAEHFESRTEVNDHEQVSSVLLRLLLYLVSFVFAYYCLLIVLHSHNIGSIKKN